MWYTYNHRLLRVVIIGIVDSDGWEAVSVRTDWVWREEMSHILAALTPPNRLACEISMTTGLRISDVLSIRTEQVLQSKDGRLTVRESKTGKTRRVRLSAELWQRACRMAGRRYVFEGRLDWRRPRTRQAVYKDLINVARVYKIRHGLRSLTLAPHSLRKIYAVDQYHRSGSLKRVQDLLRHSSEAVTIIYAMADIMTERRLGLDGHQGEQGGQDCGQALHH